MAAAAGGDPRALAFIFVTIAINAMGIGLVMPVMPTLLIELTGQGGLGEAAAWGGVATLAFASMQFLLSPTLGNLSDAYGRRPILLLSLLVMGLDYLVMATTGLLSIFILARLVAGAAAATFATANAYIADVTPPAKRAANFGLVGAGFGLGFVLGPALGGLLAEYGARAPFWAAAVLAFANLAFGFRFLPESLTAERRRPFALARANPVGAALTMLRRPAVSWLLVAFFAYNVSHYVWPVIWAYFATARFGWGPSEIGVSLAVVGVSFMIAQGVLIRRIIPWLGAERTAFIALGLDALTLLFMAFNDRGWAVYAMAPITALSALVAPSMQGIMTNRTPSDAQGELQGAVSAVTALGVVITPILMSQLFYAFTAPEAPLHFPGAPFLAASCISALALIPLWVGLNRR